MCQRAVRRIVVPVKLGGAKVQVAMRIFVAPHLDLHDAGAIAHPWRHTIPHCVLAGPRPSGDLGVSDSGLTAMCRAVVRSARPS